MSAVTSAASSAASPAASRSAAVNIPAGFPATERYPGAVNPQQYADPGPQRPVEGPVGGAWMPQQFAAGTPVVPSGGGIIDATFLTGTDAPQAPWDSSAGPPFAPSKAVDPALHAGEGLGAVAAYSTVTPAFTGQLIREVPMGQTWNRDSDTQTSIGNYSPNGRVNLDQIQLSDPAPGDGGGYAPWDPGYAERPVLLNVAYASQAVNPAANLYGVNGILPDRSQWNAYQASAYETPADPVVSQPAPPQQVPLSGGGWLSG